MRQFFSLGPTKHQTFKIVWEILNYPNAAFSSFVWEVRRSAWKISNFPHDFKHRAFLIFRKGNSAFPKRVSFFFILSSPVGDFAKTFNLQSRKNKNGHFD